MPFATKALAALQNRLRHECSQFLKNQHEMDELSDKYNRYVDLQKDTAAREKRIQTLIGVLGDKGMKNLYDDPNVAELTKREFFLKPELVDDVPLWKLIREYLNAVGKAPINDIMSFLSEVRNGSSRQAIESALNYHDEVFNVVKGKNDTFVSLK